MEPGEPLAVADLEIPVLKRGQVLVEIAFSGVCHTQVLECKGHRGPDRYLPHCLGHEGSGTVVEVGPHVSKVVPGQGVILSWISGSGIRAGGTIYSWEGRTVNAGPVTTFGKHAVVSEDRVVPLEKKLPLKEAALWGCAVPTGFGSVFNVACPEAGESLAVFGAGGIGLCAVAAASLANCAAVVAVDLLAEKLDLAKSMGATHVIDASCEDPVEALDRLFDAGVDCAIEATGRPDVMDQALRSVRARGGRAVVVGNAPHGERFCLDPCQLNQGKKLLGTWGGDWVPDRDFPRFLDLYSSSEADLTQLISKVYSLEKINQAIEELSSGSVVRPLIDMRMD